MVETMVDRMRSLRKMNAAKELHMAADCATYRILRRARADLNQLIESRPEHYRLNEALKHMDEALNSLALANRQRSLSYDVKEANS